MRAIFMTQFLPDTSEVIARVIRVKARGFGLPLPRTGHPNPFGHGGTKDESGWANSSNRLPEMDGDRSNLGTNLRYPFDPTALPASFQCSRKDLVSTLLFHRATRLARGRISRFEAQRRHPSRVAPRSTPVPSFRVTMGSFNSAAGPSARSSNWGCNVCRGSHGISARSAALHLLPNLVAHSQPYLLGFVAEIDCSWMPFRALRPDDPRVPMGLPTRTLAVGSRAAPPRTPVLGSTGYRPRGGDHLGDSGRRRRKMGQRLAGSSHSERLSKSILPFLFPATWFCSSRHHAPARPASFSFRTIMILPFASSFDGLTSIVWSAITLPQGVSTRRAPGAAPSTRHAGSDIPVCRRSGLRCGALGK